jgi:hypothetical protein
MLCSGRSVRTFLGYTCTARPVDQLNRPLIFLLSCISRVRIRKWDLLSTFVHRPWCFLLFLPQNSIATTSTAQAPPPIGPPLLLLLLCRTLHLTAWAPPRPRLGIASSSTSKAPRPSHVCSRPSVEALRPHTPATAVTPRCRWRRRPYQDTPHVANISFKYFRCFKGTLQVFHVDVVKVDRDVAHGAMAIHVCFEVYVPNVSSVSDVCCKCFIWILQK